MITKCCVYIYIYKYIYKSLLTVIWCVLSLHKLQKITNGVIYFYYHFIYFELVLFVNI